MIDPRNLAALFGSFVAGAALYAVLRFVIDWHHTFAWLAGMAIPTFAAYVIDDAMASRGVRRVPAKLPATLALCGGVIGAWAGRVIFRRQTERVFLVVLVLASIVWALLIWETVRGTYS